MKKASQSATYLFPIFCPKRITWPSTKPSIYAVGQTPDLENADLTIGRGMMAVAGEDNITMNSDGNIIALKSSQNGKYLVADENGVLTASADTSDEASKFEAYSWGQGDGYSYKCVDDNSNNGLWLKFSEDRDGNIEFGVVGTEELNVADTGLSATSYTATLPSRISVASNDDGSVNILLNCYSESFFGAEEAYYKNTLQQESQGFLLQGIKTLCSAASS